MTWLTNPYRFGYVDLGEPSLHTYWRLVLWDHREFDWRIAEIEMAASPGGADLCPIGANYRGNCVTGALAPLNDNDGTEWSSGALAFDDSAATSASTLGNRRYGSWIGAVLPVPASVREVRLRAPASSPTQMPVGFTVQGSNDGINWISYQLAFSADAWAAGEQRSFAVSEYPLSSGQANARAWRLNISDNIYTISSPAICEIGMLISGNNQVNSAGVPFASHAWPAGGHGAEQAFNGNGGDGDTWTTQSYVGHPVVIGFVWPTAKPIEQISVTADPALSSEPHKLPKSFTIEWSHDAVVWSVSATVTGEPPWLRGEVRIYGT